MVVVADIRKLSALGIYAYEFAVPKSRVFGSQRAELFVPLHKLLVLLAPGVAAAVERVAVALHSRLVAVVNAREARQGVLHSRSDFHKLNAHFALIWAELLSRLPSAVAVIERLAGNNSQSALGIVS